MKINCTLTNYETEALFDLINAEMIKNGPMAELSYISGEIDRSRLSWHLGHANFLEQMKNKLLGRTSKKGQKVKKSG